MTQASNHVNDVRVEFELSKNVLIHLLADLKQSDDKTVLYNIDYNLLYPFLWPGQKSNDFWYDTVGRNLFSLHAEYFADSNFKLLFSIPSLLELLDSIEHRMARLNKLMKSRDTVDEITRAYNRLREKRFELDDSDAQRIKRYLLSLHIPRGNGNLDAFNKMLETKKIELVSDYFDSDAIRAANAAHANSTDRVFQKMNQIRARDDGREQEHREFHYYVDAWNIGLYNLNLIQNEKELNHVCRGRIRTFYPQKFGQKYSRHPLVPLYRQYSLALASNLGGALDIESRAFLVDAVRRISDITEDIKSIEKFSQLPDYVRSKIDEVYDKFVRPLYFEYSLSADNIGKGRKMIDEEEIKHFASITTEEGFRDRFQQESEGMTKMAKAVVDVRPEILNTRLLEDYKLGNNPRVEAIKRQLKL